MGGASNKMIKKKIKEVCEINPYNEMNNVDLNFEKITDLIIINNELENKKYNENPNLDTEKNVVQIKEEETKNVSNDKYTNISCYKLYQEYEKLFNETERKYLNKMFIVYSSDGIMSNRQFWSFLDLVPIYNTTFAKIFYQTACDYNDNTQLEYVKFMDEFKFLQIVALLTKNGTMSIGKHRILLRDEKIKFLYSLFDTSGNGEIDRLEFRNIITCYVEMILTCKFECAVIQEKINSLNQDALNVSMIEKVLDQYVDEVYQSYSYNGSVLTFEEWEKWLDTVVGIQYILDFAGGLIK